MGKGSKCWSSSSGSSSRLSTGVKKDYDGKNRGSNKKSWSVADNKYIWKDKDGGKVHDHKYVERDYSKGVVREGGTPRLDD